MQNPRPLPDTLTSLGIEELKERLEVSPVCNPADTGLGLDNCCTCKIRPLIPDDTDGDGEDTVGDF